MTEFFALSDHPGIGESLNFLLSGFSIVLLTLMVLAVVTALGGKLFLLIPEQAQSSEPQKETDSPSSPVEVDTKLMSVITAAVHHSIKKPIRITKVVESGSSEKKERLKRI